MIPADGLLKAGTQPFSYLFQLSFFYHMTHRYIIICNLADKVQTRVKEHDVEVLNCMHGLQRLPVFKPDNLIDR